MSTVSLAPGTELRLGPDIICSRLPYGGAVLVNVVTLGLTEFSELDMAVIDRLLALGVPPPEAGLAVFRMVGDLVEGGWFATARAPEGNA
jgi:hypothetical protein